MRIFTPNNKTAAMKDKTAMKNIKDFDPKDLDGNSVGIKDVNKLIGNAIYFASTDILICEVARKIYKEEDFLVDETLIESVKNANRSLAPWLIEQFTLFLKA